MYLKNMSRRKIHISAICHEFNKNNSVFMEKRKNSIFAKYQLQEELTFRRLYSNFTDFWQNSVFIPSSESTFK